MTDTKPAKPQKEHDRWDTLNHMVDIGFAKYEMTASECAVWLALFRHADTQGYSEVAYSRLASGSGLKARRCKSTIKSLVAKKVVKVVQKGNYTGKSNIYQISGKTKKQHKHQPKTPET